MSSESELESDEEFDRAFRSGRKPTVKVAL